LQKVYKLWKIYVLRLQDSTSGYARLASVVANETSRLHVVVVRVFCVTVELREYIL
jgi:hypothetical protein